MANKFYVYEHWRPDKNVCFYVGKGHNKRAYLLSRIHNRYHTRIVAKLKRLGLRAEVRIVAFDLSEKVAFEVEKERIAFWRSQRVRLSNVTDGGGGTAGVFKPLEERQRVSERQKQRWQRAKILNLPWISGVRHSEETKAKMSEARKGRRHSDEARKKMSLTRKGRIFSAEHRAKIGDSQRGKIRGPMSQATKAKMSVSGRLRRDRERIANYDRDLGRAKEAAILYNSGMTLEEVGEAFGVSQTAITRLLNLIGVTRRVAKARRGHGGMRGQKLSDSHRKKIGAAIKGIKRSTDTKLRMSVSRAAWWKAKRSETTWH